MEGARKETTFDNNASLIVTWVLVGSMLDWNRDYGRAQSQSGLTQKSNTYSMSIYGQNSEN